MKEITGFQEDILILLHKFESKRTLIETLADYYETNEINYKRFTLNLEELEDIGLVEVAEHDAHLTQAGRERIQSKLQWRRQH